jgi:integrase
MGINLRTQQLTKGKLRLSLDIYANGKSRYENLKLFLYEKAITPLEREHNKRTSSLANNILAKRVLEMQEGNYNVITGFKSQASFMKYFKGLIVEHNSSESNLGNWKSAYKHLLGYTNERDVTFAEVNEDFINGFRKYLLTEHITKGSQILSKSSAASYFNKLKTALNQASNENIIAHNPSKTVKGIRSPQSKREFLLVEELRKLTNTPCIIPVLKNAFLFGCLTGVRFSDLQSLVWQQVIYSEVDGRYILHYTQKKTKKVEYHPITDAAYKLLGTRRNDDDKVFNQLHYSAWHNLRLAQWVMDAGINKKITFHCSRHTYSCLLLASGVDIFTVSNLLGHTSVQTTQIYSKIINPTKNMAVDRLPDIGI